MWCAPLLPSPLRMSVVHAAAKCCPLTSSHQHERTALLPPVTNKSSLTQIGLLSLLGLSSNSLPVEKHTRHRNHLSWTLMQYTNIGCFCCPLDYCILHPFCRTALRLPQIWSNAQQQFKKLLGGQTVNAVKYEKFVMKLTEFGLWRNTKTVRNIHPSFADSARSQGSCCVQKI